jgi:hypothetical protein
MPIDLLLVTVAKALVELAGLFILGQGLLYLLAGRKREGNFFYGLLRVLTRPVYAMVRFLTPKVIVDRHVPLVAFIVLFWLWVVLTFAKIQICAERDDRCLPPQDAKTTRAPAAGDAQSQRRAGTPA